MRFLYSLMIQVFIIFISLNCGQKGENKTEADNMKQNLSIGSEAPDFSLADQNGVQHSLSDYRGKNVILYFYPKDDTKG